MGSDFKKLGNNDRDDAVDLLSTDVENNMLLLYNIGMFGLEAGESRLSGEYFGRRVDSRLVAVGALYDLGSMLFFSRTQEEIAGMGVHVVEMGISPHFIRGKRSQCARVLDEMGGRLGDYTLYPSRLMALRRGSLRDTVPRGRARQAKMDDLDEIVEMALHMESESFDGATLMRPVMHELLALYVETGTAYLLEDGGRIVSKAEGRLAGGVGAQIGGVYTFPEFRGKGLATDVVTAVCRRLFLEVSLIALDVAEDNKPAISVYETIGFEEHDESLIASRSGGT